MSTDVSFALALGALPPQHVRVLRLDGHERLNGLYQFDLSVASALPDELFERLAIGSHARLAIRAQGMSRCVHGTVTAVRHEGVTVHGWRALRYRLRLAPRAWLMRRRRGSRIFQDTSVDRVIAATADEARVATRFELQKPLPVRAYVTQYEESDYAFVKRLAAENGLWFHFVAPATELDAALMTALDAAANPPEEVAVASLAALAMDRIRELPREVMVFADQAHYPPIRDGSVADAVAAMGLPREASVSLGPLSLSLEMPSPTLPYRPTSALVGPAGAVTEATLERSVRATRAEYREFDPLRPHWMIEGHAPPRDPRTEGGIEQRLGAPAALEVSRVVAALDPLLEPENLEVYAHHGRDLFPEPQRARAEAERSLREQQRKRRVLRGRSHCLRLEAGHRFHLEDHPVGALNRDWAVVAIEHHGVATFFAGGEAVPYTNRFACVPRETVYVPRLPPRRTVQAMVTATVAGPGGEEIHVNERGEIKVKFHWDRRADSADPSCWLRVMQAWAGASWGFQFIPRVGMEVVVTFEGGDPDKPLVVGTVYNGVHPTPFATPAHKTQSGIRTRSTPRGEGYNELQFEDAAGAERVYLRAERDFDSLVRRNRSALVEVDDHVEVRGAQRIDVVGDRAVDVHHDLRTHVHHDHETRVDANLRTSVAGDVEARIAGSRFERVEHIDRREVVGASHFRAFHDAVVRVDGNATLLVGQHEKQRSLTARVEGPVALSCDKVLDLEGEEEIVLRCGRSFIRLGPEEIEIASPSLRLRGGADAGLALGDGNARMKVAGRLQVVSDGDILLKSSGASASLGSEAKLDGARVLLNSGSLASDEIEVDAPEPTQIELRDEGGDPIPDQRYRIRFDDGTSYMGLLDDQGKAVIEVDGSGTISFPDLSDVEKA